MSLPPTTIRIKRKRTDEPVDLVQIEQSNLHLDDSNPVGKRRRTKAQAFVFQRQVLSKTDTTTTQPTLLGARPIKPLHRAASSHSLGTKNQQSTPQPDLSQIQNAPNGGVSTGADVWRPAQTSRSGSASGSEVTSSSNGPMQKQPVQVRRFHISRPPPSQDLLTSGVGHSRKRKTETIFVERRVRPKTPDPQPTESLLLPSKPETTPIQPQKKPGRNARTPIPRTPDVILSKPSPTPTRTTPVPLALRNRWDVNSDELVAEMQAYTLQEIGYNLTEAEAMRPTSSQPANPVINRYGSDKFKPTAPKTRYYERHPEEARQIAALHTKVDCDSDVDMGSDDEYVVDTYIRVPVEALKITATNIGLLVLDSEVDIEEFYAEDDDSDEEDDLEDEDENAENHYSADYPDEEVDSDDEYGRNAYNYRNNGSDDEFDATYSDSEDESTKYPWKTKEKSWLAQTNDDSD